jgi:hypothetical protein
LIATAIIFNAESIAQVKKKPPTQVEEKTDSKKISKQIADTMFDLVKSRVAKCEDGFLFAYGFEERVATIDYMKFRRFSKNIQSFEQIRQEIGNIVPRKVCPSETEILNGSEAKCTIRYRLELRHEGPVRTRVDFPWSEPDFSPYILFRLDQIEGNSDFSLSDALYYRNGKWNNSYLKQSNEAKCNSFIFN